MELVVVSGKGGVGKTTVSSSLAYLLGKKGIGLVVADADVDTPSLHLVLGLKARTSEKAFLSRKAEVDTGKCIRCGRCLDICPYGALVLGEGGFPEPLWYMCEGCGACEVVCPSGAISTREALTGEILEGETRYGQPMITAQLEVGEHNSGLLVSKVRLRAKEIAAEQGRPFLLVDGAPGIGCPVVSSLVGADRALIVVEPTPSSLRGALRVLEVAKHFSIPASSIINKFDISGFWREAESVLNGSGAPVIAKIPYDEAVVRALAQEKPLPELFPSSEAAEALRRLADLVAEDILGR